MRDLLKLLTDTGRPTPCLFYPAIAENGLSIAEALTDARKQSDLLLAIARDYPVGGVVRMSELWCEAASFGMACDLSGTGFPRLGDALFEEAEEIESLNWPSAVNPVTEPMIEAMRVAAHAIDQPLFAGITGPYTLGSVLNGSEDFMVNCMSEPEDMHGFLDRLTDFLIDYALEYQKSGITGLMIAEPSIAMVSPAMADAFSNAYVQRIIDAVQTDRFAVIYHNCGDMNAHMPGIAKLNCDGFHFGSAVDLRGAAGMIGAERPVMGNVEPQLFLGAPERVKDAVSALEASLAGCGNWVLSTGCDLAPGTRRVCLDAFF